MEPNEARALTNAAYLKIEGQLTSGGTSVAHCSNEVGTATIETPVQISTLRCTLSSDIDRISIIDRRTSAVLKTWRQGDPQ